jgi:hypothetical protein
MAQEACIQVHQEVVLGVRGAREHYICLESMGVSNDSQAHAHAVGSIDTPHTKVTPSQCVETWMPLDDGQHPHRRGTGEQAS